MSVVYLVRQGTTLRRKDDNLALFAAGKLVERIPSGQVERLVVLGNVTLAPSAVAFILTRGIDAVFLSWSGRYLGRLRGGTGKNVFLRLRQYSRMEDAAFRLDVARAMIAAKVRSQAAVLETRLKEGPDELLSAGRRMLREGAASAAVAPDLDTLRGCEGRAGAVYFRCFGELLRGGDFVFSGRNRRPPRDPVNVLLSLGYTLLLGALEREVESAGLDPAVGCFHELVYGRPSLVLDLQEEFRAPVVDLLVLRACNRRLMRPQDFYFPGDMAEEAKGMAEFGELEREAAVVLSFEGFRKFITLFEQRVQERITPEGEAGPQVIAALLRRQVARYVRAVKGEEVYEALVLDPRR